MHTNTQMVTFLLFLITLNGKTTTNNVSYTNLGKKILNYITTNHFKNFETSDYILLNNSELSLDNINILNPFLKINNTKISISSILLIEIIIYWISLPITVDGSTRSGEARKRACEDNYYI